MDLFWLDKSILNFFHDVGSMFYMGTFEGAVMVLGGIAALYYTYINPKKTDKKVKK
ncbi:MAG: hypothetical protein Q8920_16165 [Bacillota bacterium]|nr:hypothetical protein [Bacillota bacterium]